MRNLISFLLIAVWIILGFFGVSYNLIKSRSEVKNWAYLGDEDKKFKLYGDLYTFLKFTKQNTPETAAILLISNDHRAFYLGRYFLYPRKVERIFNISELKSDGANRYEFIASFNTNLNTEKFKLVKSFKYNDNSKVGLLYKNK